MADSPQPPDSSHLHSGQAGSTRSILVVEDDLSLARLLEALLTSAGYGVRIATDGERALEEARATPTALVLLDLTLPKMDGWEVLDQLQADAQPPPVVLFTGHYDAEERALNAGAAAMILKPFDVDDLLATVDRLTGATS